MMKSNFRIKKNYPFMGQISLYLVYEEEFCSSSNDVKIKWFFQFLLSLKKTHRKISFSTIVFNIHWLFITLKPCNSIRKKDNKKQNKNPLKGRIPPLRQKNQEELHTSFCIIQCRYPAWRDLQRVEVVSFLPQQSVFVTRIRRQGSTTHFDFKLIMHPRLGSQPQLVLVQPCLNQDPRLTDR